MVPFLLFCIASVGMTLIIVRGVVFQSFRAYFEREAGRLERRRNKKGLPPSFTLMEFINEAIHCVQCTGFWCGLFCGLYLISSEPFWVWDGLSSPRYIVNRLLMLFCCGTAGSFLATLGDNIVEWIFFSKETSIRTLQTGDPIDPPNGPNIIAQEHDSEDDY